MVQPAVDDAVDFARIRRVLVIKLRHHGDVLLTSPVFSVLRRAAPQAEVDALVYGETAPMLERHGIHGIFAPIGLPHLHRKIPFVQKNQLVRGRLGEDGVADAYTAVAEEVAHG